ncbi:hypothetical protein VTN31DRAFT_6779 [Thermomyces dupontii]|uniref:uncharacterized protein n=1 Tax=Talaromyces thermophilus TaxID=28565 RepID=UPI003744693B
MAGTILKNRLHRSELPPVPQNYYEAKRYKFWPEWEKSHGLLNSTPWQITRRTPPQEPASLPTRQTQRGSRSGKTISWAHSNGTGVFGNTNPWLFDRVTRMKRLRDRFVSVEGQHDGQLVWYDDMVNKYLKSADRFLERLLLLIHVTGGQPARAPELLSLRHRNTRGGGIRNVFIESGLVATLTRYHKTYGTTSKERTIYRYLPSAMSELVVYYLWLVKPFCETLREVVLRDSNARSRFLWPLETGPGIPAGSTRFWRGRRGTI